MEKIMWLVLGGVAFVAALRASNSDRARRVGRWAIGVLFIVFGAAVNAIYLTLGDDAYADFAEPSPFAFVRDTWASLVVPHQAFFISLLILGEAAAGALVLAGGRRTQVGLASLMAFHVGQLAFGGVLWVWAPLMLLTLGLLLRAEVRAARTSRTPTQRVDGMAPRPTARAGTARWLHTGGTSHVDRHS
jgi:hypothetical protein